MAQAEPDRLVSLRRELHRYPEPAWREYYTTARIVVELERIGVDELYFGPDALGDERRGVPPDSELDRWYDRALQAGAREDILQDLKGGWTGAVAVLRRGDGPRIGLRVDIDALPRTESSDAGHIPADEGFRAVHDDAMHACGHDAHIAIGIGVLEAIADSSFTGTLVVYFQPAEELVAGGEPLAESGHLDDLDALLAIHVGLDHPTGEIVAGIGGFLAVRGFEAEFLGEGAHAGASPQEGRNAMQAAATAIENLYGITRHSGGTTRVNVGVIEGGTASNIIPEEVRIEGEVRGDSTELCDYVWQRARRILDSAADMHECTVEVDVQKTAPSAESDPGLASIVGQAARRVEGVSSIVDRDDLGGSEDATYLMQHVQNQGGEAAYVCIGTDHPGSHHSATFDVDEDSIRIGIDVITETITRLASEA